MTATIETAETVETASTRIIASRLDDCRAKIEKANRRLDKAGIAERFELVVSDEYVTSSTDEAGFETFSAWRDVELVTPAIGYNGWTFVATLSFEEAGTVVRTVPGQEIDYRPTSKVCDQCHTARERNETFVVRNDETGEVKQVGRNCLALFFGLKPVLWVFGYGIEEFAADNNDGGSIAYDRRDSVRAVVAAALAASNGGTGYVSAQSYDRTSTKATASFILGPVPTGRQSEQARMEQDELRVQALAFEADGTVDKVISAAKAIDGASAYAENIRILANCEYSDPRNFGLVVSFVAVYAKANRVVAEKKAQPVKVNAWVGAEGDKKVVTTGTVVMVRTIEGDFGTSYLIKWVTTEGLTCKWFASNPADEVVEGATLTFTGTIKKLETYQGVKETSFTRCKTSA